jgi:hypothetical protein
MPDVTVSADIDAFLVAANDAAARGELALTTLAITTPGTGVATALGVNVGSAGAFVTFNGAGGTPSSLVGTNITGTAAGLTAGVASAVAVGGITGLGANIATFLATPSSANLALAVTGETGSGALVFGTSPSITTSIVSASTTLAVFDTVATTVNAFGVATALNIGAAAATILNFGGFTSAAELRFLEPSGSGTNYSGFKQGALGTSITYTLPSDAPVNGDVLTAQASGALSWETPSGAANAVTLASAAAGAGLLIVSAGADRTATATDTVTTINTTNANVTTFVLGGVTVTATGTELNFVDGVTSAIQTQLNAKQATITFGTGVQTALGVNVGSAGAPILFNGAGGTPSSMVGTNITGLAPANIVAGTLGGTITLGEGAQQIALDPALSADGTYSGITMTGTAGYTQAFGDLVYLDPTDSRWEAVDANAAAGADGDARGSLCMVVIAGTDGTACTLLVRGKIRADANFPSFTINNPIYVSETAGDVTQTQPTTTDVVIRIVGWALTADEMMFAPDNMWITHT